jgi:hypothetical protein
MSTPRSVRFQIRSDRSTRSEATGGSFLGPASPIARQAAATDSDVMVCRQSKPCGSCVKRSSLSAFPCASRSDRVSACSTDVCGGHGNEHPVYVTHSHKAAGLPSFATEDRDAEGFSGGLHRRRCGSRRVDVTSGCSRRLCRLRHDRTLLLPNSAPALPRLNGRATGFGTCASRPQRTIAPNRARATPANAVCADELCILVTSQLTARVLASSPTARPFSTP